MTYEIGAKILVQCLGGDGLIGHMFVATVITPEWAKFMMASNMEQAPLSATFLERLKLTEYRVRYGAYDEVLCGMMDVMPANVCWVAFRIRDRWMFETFQPYPGYYSKYGKIGSMTDVLDGTWSTERVRIEVLP